jgi:hypothetical protein
MDAIGVVRGIVHVADDAVVSSWRLNSFTLTMQEHSKGYY